MTRRSNERCSTKILSRWILVEIPDCGRCRSDGRSVCVIAVVSSRGVIVRHLGAIFTTVTNGTMAAKPNLTTAPYCAAATTRSFTVNAGKSPSNAADQLSENLTATFSKSCKNTTKQPKSRRVRRVCCSGSSDGAHSSHGVSAVSLVLAHNVDEAAEFQAEAGRLVGEVLSEVRYITLDYGSDQYRGDVVGPRNVTSPDEWARPQWSHNAYATRSISRSSSGPTLVRFSLRHGIQHRRCVRRPGRSPLGA